MSVTKPVADLKLIARQRVPIEVGSLQLGPDGALTESDPNAPLRFGFRYQGALFAAEMSNDKSTLLRLTARLGRLPFTAENPFARRCVSRIMTAGRPPRGRFWIDDDGGLRLDMEARHRGTRTPVSVLHATVSLLLEARPRMLLLNCLLRPLPHSRAEADRASAAKGPKGGSDGALRAAE